MFKWIQIAGIVAHYECDRTAHTQRHRSPFCGIDKRPKADTISYGNSWKKIIGNPKAMAISKCKLIWRTLDSVFFLLHTFESGLAHTITGQAPIEELIILAFRRIHQFKAFTLTEGRRRLIKQIKGNRINCDLLACRQAKYRDECRHQVVTPSIAGIDTTKMSCNL